MHLKSIEIYCKFVAGISGSGSGGDGETKDRGEGRKYGAGDKTNVDRNGGAEKSGWGQYIEYVV